VRSMLTPRAAYHAVLKYDRNQLRHPSGSGEGGRWAKGTSAVVAR